MVLAGDYEGHRIEKAAELIREGYVPAALISGPRGFYGGHESDYAIAYAVRQGFPAQWFIALPHSALSTREEARVVLAELRRRNVRSFLLVTSDYHTRPRAAHFPGRRARHGGRSRHAHGGGPRRVSSAPIPGGATAKGRRPSFSSGRRPSPPLWAFDHAGKLGRFAGGEAQALDRVFPESLLWKARKARPM